MITGRGVFNDLRSLPRRPIDLGYVQVGGLRPPESSLGTSTDKIGAERTTKGTVIASVVGGGVSVRVVKGAFGTWLMR